MSKQNFRQASKDSDWLPIGENPSREDINAGSLQRIADALEVLSKSWLELIADRDFQKRRKDELALELKLAEKRNAALKGHITRLKKRSLS